MKYEEALRIRRDTKSNEQIAEDILGLIDGVPTYLLSRMQKKVIKELCEKSIPRKKISGRCPNCQIEVNNRYCPECGQRIGALND